MKRESWNKLRKGSIVRSVKSGVKRMVIEANPKANSITLKSLTNGQYRLWSGHIRQHTAGETTTTYVSCDRYNFKVVRF